MMKTEVALLLIVLAASSGCVRTQPNNPVSINASQDYEVYGFDDGFDSVLGNRMIIGMVQAEKPERITAQIESGFKTLYENNSARDYYVVELRHGDDVVLFVRKGVDIGEYVTGKIDAAEFNTRNKNTMSYFYGRINQTLDNETFDATLI
ncbi:MAG: hypothetical protein V1921_00690 [Candidatus Altiarchaeota archaeon]